MDARLLRIARLVAGKFFEGKSARNVERHLSREDLEVAAYTAASLALETSTRDTRHGDYVAATKVQSAQDDADRLRQYPHVATIEHDRLNRATLSLPPCGCNVTGRGTLTFPIRIVFCKTHGGE